MPANGELLHGFLLKKAEQQSKQRVEQKQTSQQGEAPKSIEELLQQRRVLAWERGKSLIRTAKRIEEARIAHSTDHNPQELLRVEGLLRMQVLGVAKALHTIDGTYDSMRGQFQQVENEYPNYTRIVEEFSEEKNPDNLEKK
jgi:hypothetical protein